MNYQFPKDFKWGSAVWAQGTEGAHDKDGKAPTVFDEYYRLQPESFYNQVGPSETLHWYENYEEYAKLAKEIQHNSFRTSIMWARLMPDGKNVSKKAVQFYKNLFKSFKDRGMELSIVLYWFDMPLKYEDMGGFTTRLILPDFVNYCKTCFDIFDGLVDTWYIYNEPLIDVLFKYQQEMCYPNKRDFNLANNAIYNMIIGHAMVVEQFKSKSRLARIGTVLNESVVYPRSHNKEDLEAAKIVNMVEFECFENPFLKGYIDPEWFAFMKKCKVSLDIKEEDSELIKNNTISYLGLNLYSCERVQAKPSIDFDAKISFFSFADPYELPNAKMNKDRGWEIYPDVIYDVLMKMKTEFNNPTTFITENGMGVQNESRFRDESGIIQDDYRIEYVTEHLKCAHKAISQGANLVGYNMWSFVDLWSPSNQFKNCYGFYEYDLENGQTRKKKSADWFKTVTLNNGF